jgi:hypothetical protein
MEDYSHMMMEVKLMVDGDDGGEDGLRSPPLGEKSWIDLILESMIVALAALYFMNSPYLIGHPLFDIYEGVRENWRQGGARGPNEQAPCMGHARLGLEHSIVSLRCSDSFFT